MQKQSNKERNLLRTGVAVSNARAYGQRVFELKKIWSQRLWISPSLFITWCLTHFFQNATPGESLISNGKETTFQKGRQQVRKNQSRSFIVKNAYSVPKLKITSRKTNWPALKHQWKHLNDLDLPFIDSIKVTVLLGRDVMRVHDVLDVRMPLEGIEAPDGVRPHRPSSDFNDSTAWRFAFENSSCFQTFSVQETRWCCRQLLAHGIFWCQLSRTPTDEQWR